jgi:hypothetical protein
MIPYDIDPSLHSTEPEHHLLDDGFSPPGPAAPSHPSPHEASLEEALAGKSEF